MTSKKKQRLLWLAAGAVVVLSAAYWTFGSGPARRAAIETAPVERGDLTVELPATGSIDAVNVIDVGTVVSGRIKALHVDFNDRVQAGQLLAEIEDDDFRAAHLQTQADLTAARAAIEVATANLESAREDQVRAGAYAERAQALYRKAQSDLERHQKLLAEGIVTQAVFDRIESAYQTARAEAASVEALAQQSASRIKSAQAAIEQARAVAEQRAARAALAKRNLDYCRITSPVKGVVVSRNVDVGQTVAARLQAPSLFHIAEDLSHMYVYTKLDSADISKVRPGLSAFFTVNAFPGETFEGKLIEVRINPNPENPVSRATPTGQIQRTIAAGVTSGPFAGTDAGGGAAPAAGSGSGGGGSGRQSSSSSAAASAPSSGGVSSGPPVGTRNTVVFYDALIEFRNPDEKLLPGMTAYVTIPINSVQDALKVPTAALRFSPDLPPQERQALLQASGVREEDSLVWVVAPGKRFHPIVVKPILTDFVYTAVQSDQLKPGMQVATRATESKPAS